MNEEIRKAFENEPDICFDTVEFIDGRYVYYDQDSKTKKTHQTIHAAWVGFKAGFEHQQKRFDELEKLNEELHHLVYEQSSIAFTIDNKEVFIDGIGCLNE
jgi:hypothetical protein